MVACVRSGGGIGSAFIAAAQPSAPPSTVLQNHFAKMHDTSATGDIYASTLFGPSPQHIFMDLKGDVANSALTKHN